MNKVDPQPENGQNQISFWKSLALRLLLPASTILITFLVLAMKDQNSAAMIVFAVGSLLIINRELLIHSNNENTTNLQLNLLTNLQTNLQSGIDKITHNNQKDLYKINTEINKKGTENNENYQNLLAIERVCNDNKIRCDAEKNLFCKLILLYDSIPNYLKRDKNTIIEKAQGDLDILFGRNRSQVPLDGYQGLVMSIERLNQLTHNDTVKAITFLLKEENQADTLHPIWKMYREANLEAAKRGATVERIFISDYDLLGQEKFWEKIYVKSHETKKGSKDSKKYLPTNNNLYGFFYDKKRFDEKFKKIDIKSIRFGFMMINKEIVMIDMFDDIENGIAKGDYKIVANCNLKTINGEWGIEKIDEFFEELKNVHSEVLNQDDVDTTFGPKTEI
jgi:hypothetical protein